MTGPIALGSLTLEKRDLAMWFDGPEELQISESEEVGKGPYCRSRRQIVLVSSTRFPPKVLCRVHLRCFQSVEPVATARKDPARLISRPQEEETVLLVGADLSDDVT